jgi:hypothetical protein
MQSFFDALARQLPGDAHEIMLGFSLSDASRLEALLAAAGFGDVRVKRDVRQLAFDSFDHYWGPFEAGGYRVCQLYRRLPDSQRRAVAEELPQQVARFESGGRLVTNVERGEPLRPWPADMGRQSGFSHARSLGGTRPVALRSGCAPDT